MMRIIIFFRLASINLPAWADIFFRDTRLTPGNTLRLFAQQIASGNVACSAMNHLAGFEFTDTAWCQARQRLRMELIEQGIVFFQT